MQELFIKLFKVLGEKPGPDDVWEPLNVRLDMKARATSDEDRPFHSSSYRLRVTAPEGNLIAPEIDRVLRVLDSVDAPLNVEIVNNGLEIAVV